MKECSVCHQSFPLSNYSRHPETADGYYTYCKQCKAAKIREMRAKNGNKWTHKYEKTKKGFLVRLYRNMKSRITGVQKAKYHLYAGKELLPKEDFYSWALSHQEFHRLFAQYEQSGFDKQKAPSVDRIDTDKGYIVSNMRWMTYRENSALGGLTHARQIKRRVSQYDLAGNYIATYESLTQAAAKFGVDSSNICMAVNGRIKTAKGFVWKAV